MWFKNLLRGILEENKDIVGLLKDFKPWPKSATRRFVRASLWRYTFSERGADGKWPSTFWSRKRIGDYSLPLLLEWSGATPGPARAPTPAATAKKRAEAEKEGDVFRSIASGTTLKRSASLPRFEVEAS
jgi:hypothetical protein